MEIANATEYVVFRPEQRAAGAAAKRENAPKETYRQSGGKVRSQMDAAHRDRGDEEWHKASGDLLYVHKRTYSLAKLLHAKLSFTELTLDVRGKDLLLTET